MVELNANEEEKAIMSPSVSDSHPAEKEKFTWGSLFNPPCKTPTSSSGQIVYMATSAIGKCTGKCLTSAVPRGRVSEHRK